MASRVKSAAPKQGVYAIRCLVNGKIYAGSAADLGKRTGGHKAQLRRGGHFLLPRLQKDWNTYGESAFVFYEQPLHLSMLELRGFERELILAWKCLEHMNGYNKMVGSSWGPEASIRNIEDKLVRYKKFSRLPGVQREAPMASEYVRTFVRPRPVRSG